MFGHYCPMKYPGLKDVFSLRYVTIPSLPSVIGWLSKIDEKYGQKGDNTVFVICVYHRLIMWKGKSSFTWSLIKIEIGFWNISRNIRCGSVLQHYLFFGKNKYCDMSLINYNFMKYMSTFSPSCNKCMIMSIEVKLNISSECNWNASMWRNWRAKIIWTRTMRDDDYLDMAACPVERDRYGYRIRQQEKLHDVLIEFCAGINLNWANN